MYYHKVCLAKKGQKENIPRLKVFALSAKYLKEFCNTADDIANKINRMPSDDYILDVVGNKVK